jgi:hypothetical protein
MIIVVSMINTVFMNKTIYNKNNGLQKAYGSYDVVIGRFLCFAYTIIFEN